jgi:hypothetical protein
MYEGEIKVEYARSGHRWVFACDRAGWPRLVEELSRRSVFESGPGQLDAFDAAVIVRELWRKRFALGVPT